MLMAFTDFQSVRRRVLMTAIGLVGAPGRRAPVRVLSTLQ